MSATSLKSALNDLPATGRDGFEGLLALVLARVSGNPMRLAASGFQFGVDGQGENPANPVCFEAKRYSSKLTREAVLTKIADLGRRKSEAEILWVLGATVAVPNQLAQDLSTDGENQGIATLVLDWNDQELPALGIVLANAGDDIAAWIASRTQASVTETEIEGALISLKNSEVAKLRWKSLQSEFSAKEISGRQAIEANKKWLRATLSSAAKARYRLGQPTAPLNPDTPNLRREAHLQAIVEGHCKETTCLVLGAEGVGKSWVAAEAAVQFPGLTVALSAEALEGVNPAGFENLLVEAFAQQTENAPGSAERWRRRFLAWETVPPSEGFMVVVDGINQRPDLAWDKILNALEALIEMRGGRLLITSRPQYYQRNVLRGFNRKQRVIVADWKSSERDEILGLAGIVSNVLDQTTLNSLLNPRLLGIAIEVLPIDEPLAWSGLTTESLLFEHINRMQSDGFEDQSPNELIKALSDRAGNVLDALRVGETLSSELVFEDSLLAVKETRFFQSRQRPSGGYVIKQEGLSLALGFAVVDRILGSSGDSTQFDPRARELIEPISALDQTSRVVLAAMHVCACDPEREAPELFKVLVSIFCELQNLEERAYPQFFDVVRRNPEATLNAAKEKLLEWRSPINEKWLVASVKQMMEHTHTKPSVQDAIESWLRHVNTDAFDQQSKYGRLDDKDQERAERRQAEIDEAIAAFSDYERQLFAQCHVTTGDTDSLLTQSFELLAGEPLAPWASSFAAFGLGVHLDHSIHQASKAFFQLTQLNRVDPIQAAEAYAGQAMPLSDPDVSRAGKWCLVKLLYASGREKDAKGALKIGKKLRETQNVPELSFSRLEQLCANDPCDPYSTLPSNVGDTIEDFATLDVSPIMTTMGRTSEDLNYGERLCAVCRFGPKTAITKASELCREILTREGLPLRQFALCGTTLTPLLGREAALHLSKRLQSNKDLKTLPENELKIIKCYMTNFALPFLTGEEQLELLTCEALAGNYSLDAIPSLKKPNEEAVLDCLEQCARSGLNEAAFSALSLVAHTYEALSPALENTVAGFMDNDLSLVRSAVFEIALATDNERLRTAHLAGDWKASEALTNASYENTYGSALLIDAVVSRACEFESILPRISYESWALAQRRIGGEVTGAIVELLDQRLRKATALSSQLDSPEIAVTMAPHDHVLHNFRSIEDRPLQVEANSQSLFGDVESDEDFQSRQQRNHRLFGELEEAMADKDILVIAQQIDFEAFQGILKSNTNLGGEWLDLLLGLPSGQLRWFKDFALVVAANMMKSDEAKAMSLLETAIASEAFVRRMYPDALSLEHKAIWACPRTAVSEVLWKKRFEGCVTDDMLALEVLAAERFGAKEFVRDYASELTSSERPIDKALAITIAGFSMQYKHFQPLLNEIEPTAGFIGAASKAARIAHEKALWAQHWVDQMWAAQTPEQFWIKLVLAAKIMDARLDYDAGIYQCANKWGKFASMFTRERKDRIKKWKRHREKKLYGSDRPAPVFLT
ncbi:hypothetical protein SAMN04488030_3040 [Aliiroseovarius halocynthiae]|uniref:Uncharacterized protein n=1 Tax=Aliiroseovarius halocynthiae TaxID=985055 RepID=A0A545SMM8_9RHOB|nr:hypothetical protein [Aliiroseovarius halocynthiae]TQV66207.1 hypothetical protein FIL88_14220 [Aliiroseovarius halocynthiae]SMR82679.1 hypothetical protein SAMN04488030_3040 [Aliiroseovarius halocynthiae]